MVTLAILCGSAPRGPSPPAAPPPRRGSYSVWFSPPGLSGQAMWDFQSLLGARGVTLEGGGGPPRRGPPLLDGDWTRLRRGLGLVRGGARAFRRLGSRPGEAVAAEQPVGTRSILARRVPSPKGRVGGRSGRPLYLITRGRGWRLSRVRRGTSGAGGGRGVAVEGVRGAGSGRRLQD